MPGRRSAALSLDAGSILARLRAQPAVASTIAVTVLLASFLLSAAPRLLEDVAAEDLESTVSEPVPAQRNIRVERFARIGAGGAADPFRAVREIGDAFAESEIPPAVAAVTSGHTYVAESPRFAIGPLPGEDPPHPFEMFLRFRYQDGIEDHWSVVTGTLPEPRAPETILTGPGCPRSPEEVRAITERLQSGETPEGLECALTEVPHFEVAVTAETAEALGLSPGHRMVLRPDGSDPLFFGLSGDALAYEVVVSISGIVELDAPTLEYWYGDRSLHLPFIQENPDFRIIFATGVMAPEDYGRLTSTLGTANWSYAWRYFVDPGLVRRADVATLRSALTPFEAFYSPVASPTEPRVITQLSDLLAAHVAQRAQTIALMSVAAAGLFSVVVAVVFLLATLMTDRQRRGIVQIRNRGGSRGQMALTRLYESMLLMVPAAVLGYWLAAWLFPGTDGSTALRATFALVLAATSLVVASALPLFTRPLGSLQREQYGSRARGASSSRLVGEVLVLVLAVGSVLLLRRRGLAGGETADLEVDMLLAVTPVLLALAVAVVTVRLFPLVMSLCAWLGSRLRGLVVFVGFRRDLGQSPSTRLPVLAIILCTAAATGAAVTRASMASGQEASSWQAIGADYAITGALPHSSLPAAIDFVTLPGVDDLALGKSFPDGRVETASRGVAAEVLAIDSMAFDRITRETPLQGIVPRSLLDPGGPARGTDEHPLPVIVSDDWPNNVALAEGEVFTLDLGNVEPRAAVAEVRDRHPGMPDDRPFVVVDLRALESTTEVALPATVAYLRAGRDAGAALSTLVEESRTGARITSRYDTLDAVGTDPFVEWSGLGHGIVLVSAIALAIVSAVSTMALGSARRRRDLAYLRTMGLDTGQATLVTLIELGPAVLIGIVVGVLTGVATSLILEPALDLGAFTGGLVPTPVTVDWAAVGLATVALASALLIAVVILVLVNRHDDLGRALRIGDET